MTTSPTSMRVQSSFAAGQSTESAKIQRFESLKAVVRVFRGLPKSSDAPLALTIGNFDGVHRGHQAMLTRLIEGAEDLRLVPAVLAVGPHPRGIFAPDSAPPPLSTFRGQPGMFRALC